MKLENKIEAILFFKGEPISTEKLASILEASPQTVKEALLNLERALSERGLALIYKDDEVMLGTHPNTSSLIEEIIKEDLQRELGRAGLETLSTILYLGPISRSEIDYIRGVNSTFILRNLLIRGLVERTENPGDRRSFLYKPTFELLSYLGIRRIEELPEYETVRTEMETKRKVATETNIDKIEAESAIKVHE